MVFRGDGSALEAVRLFQAAKVVLGPHGAGLSNIAFAAPNTTGEGEGEMIECILLGACRLP